MNKFLVLIILSAFSFNTAFAATIGFEFEEDATDFPWIGRSFTPGVVRGNLYGLPEDGSGVFPTSFEFTSDVSGVGITSNYEFFSTVENGAGFTIVGGVVVAADVLVTFDDPVNGGMQLRFNFDGWNVLHWNGGTGPQTAMGNQNGFDGAVYGAAFNGERAAAVPTMNKWGLITLALMLGLFGFWVRNKQESR